MNDRGPPPDVTVHSVTLVTPVVSDFVYRRLYLIKEFSKLDGTVNNANIGIRGLLCENKKFQ